MIDAKDYQFISALLRRCSGLALGPGKEYFLESRLPAVATTYGMRSVTELIALLREAPHAQLEKAVCDALMTAETLFFRDGAPFELMRTTLLPALAARCRAEVRPIRIWSAAAATGQEPYSVAMMLAESRALLDDVGVELFATDFCTHAINRARRGVFTPLEVRRGLPAELLVRYFTSRAESYAIDDAIRRRVVFTEFNLLDSFTQFGTFDIILCRNVLFYFDAETKRDVARRMRDILTPGGYFFLGATETAVPIAESFRRSKHFGTAVYEGVHDRQYFSYAGAAPSGNHGT